MDVLKRANPDASDAKVVRAGRITTVVVMILAMLWSTQGDQFGTIFEAVNKIPMTFAPAVTTVFVFGVLWPRGTWQAAMTTLYTGTIIGAIYFVADLPLVGRMILGDQAHAGFGGLVSDPTQGLGIPFMLVGPIIAVACIAIYVVASFVTPPMDKRAVSEVCWDHPLAFLKGPISGASDPRLVSAILVVVVGTLYFWLR
jgi:SSS family solute:Na+ symporter